MSLPTTTDGEGWMMFVNEPMPPGGEVTSSHATMMSATQQKTTVSDFFII